MPVSDHHHSDHAVVIGASLAGLLAARILTEHFERVTVIERDPAPAVPAARKGVPQAHHPHILLARGLTILESLFPGFSRQLTRQGAVPSGDYCWYRFGVWTRLEPFDVPMHSHSHPFLEHLLRQRLEALPAVRFLHGNVLEPLLDERKGRIAGVHIENREEGCEQTLAVSAIVDAGGRGSRTPHWFERLGFDRPRTSRVEIDLAYSSCLYTLPAIERDWQGMVIVEEGPDRRRAAGLMPVEKDRWAITVSGYHKAPVPHDHEGILAFLKSLPQPQLYTLIRSANPVTEVQTRKLPGSLWHHYEHARRLPDNYFVIGEALCSLNPASAAGVSLAALEAEALRTVLERAPRHPARSYFRRAAATVATAWLIATSEDFAFTPTRGRPPPGIRLFNWYRRRAFLVCADNKLVQRRALEVVNLIEPPRSLLRPDVLLPVLLPRKGSNRNAEALLGRGEPSV